MQSFLMTIYKLLIEDHEGDQMKTTLKFSNEHNLSFVSTIVLLIFTNKSLLRK